MRWLALLLLWTCLCHTPTVPTEFGRLTGYWSRYGKEPTNSQIWYHTTVTGKLEDPSRYAGFIAVRDCARVGQTAIAHIEGKGSYRVFVFDCASRIDGAKDWMTRNRIVGELDYYLLQRLAIPHGRAIEGSIEWLEGR